MAPEPPFAERPDEGEIQPVLPSPAQSFPDRAEALEGYVEGGSVPVQPVESAEIPTLVPPPSRPQPGFWLGILVTLFMFVVCQIGIPVIVVVAWMMVRSVGAGDPMKRLGELATKEGMK